MLKTSGIIEIILYVSNMDGMVRHYRDTMGLSVTFPPNKIDYSKEFWVTLHAGSCVLALHGGGQKRLGPDAPKIVFGVSDIHTNRKTLLENNVQMGEVRAAAPGVLVCDGFDPEGNPFSLESHGTL